MEVSQIVKVLERLDEKVDEIRDSVQELNVTMNGTSIKQSWQEKEIESLKGQVSSLKEAHDKATGALKLLSLPGVIGFLYAVLEVLKQ